MSNEKDIIDRLARVETKVDMLLDMRDKRFEFNLYAGIALITSIIAVGIALI